MPLSGTRTDLSPVNACGKVLSCLMKLYLPSVSGSPLDKCTRVCLASEIRLYYTFGKMKDGTPCPPTKKGYKDARCVGGNCLVSYRI